MINTQIQKVTEKENKHTMEHGFNRSFKTESKLKSAEYFTN